MAELEGTQLVEPISLYFDLEQGFVADLEIVSRAALAWTAAIKEAAVMVDPFLDVRIEVASGTSGSFSLNSLLRDLRITKEEEKVTLKALAFIILAWMGAHVLDYTFERASDAITGHDSDQFTPEQRRELAEIVQKAVASKSGDQHLQQVYREIERDPAIKGIGATLTPGARPAYIVPRSDFRARSGRAGSEVQQISTRRTTVERVRVGLISPVLLPGTRRWRLRSPQGEFGAAIKDEDFINRVLLGTTSLRLRAGIDMEVELETNEEFKSGVWQVIDRNVLHVDQLFEPPRQASLFASAPEDDQANDHKE